jgi:hypothetical protein
MAPIPVSSLKGRNNLIANFPLMKSRTQQHFFVVEKSPFAAHFLELQVSDLFFTFGKNEQTTTSTSTEEESNL